MRAVVAVQARLGSTRLPKKVLADIEGRSLVAQVCRRAAATRVPVFISCPPEDAVDIAKAAPGYGCVPGPEVDVLSRMLLVAAYAKATHVVRVTADCPLVPHDLIRAGLEAAQKTKAPCVQNWRPRTFPDGFDFEVWDVAFLVSLRAKLEERDCEYFAQWCLDHKLPNFPITAAGENTSRFRLTVDYQEDLDVIRALYKEQGEDIWESGTVIDWCRQHPEVMAVNEDCADGSFGAKK